MINKLKRLIIMNGQKILQNEDNVVWKIETKAQEQEKRFVA